MKQDTVIRLQNEIDVVPYIGTWIETEGGYEGEVLLTVVPYIGTWIETRPDNFIALSEVSYLI